MNTLNQMIDLTINSAGEWNAQLFRELKGRLNSNNVTLTLLMSVFAQVFLVMTFFTLLPINPMPGKQAGYQNYCINLNGHCQLDYSGAVIIDWSHWWTDIFGAISWVISTLLVVGGLYFLSNDLRREETRGTLNFVRLSPQSAANIFIGKILGVPILIYLAVASTIPLQLFVGANQGFGVVNTVVFDGLWLVIAGLFYLVAMLLTAITPVMPIGITLLAWCLQFLVGKSMQFMISTNNSNLFTQDAPTWFYLPISSSALHLMIFIILSCSILAYCLWSILCRHYSDSYTTLISKKQSYEFNALFQAWLLGIALPLSSHSDISTKGYLISIVSAQIVFALILIKAIIPNKDTLQEWCCQTDLRFNISGKSFWQQKWFNELFWEDRSPAVLTLGLNLVVAAVIWLPISLVNLESLTMAPASCFVVLTMLNYGMLMQLAVSSKWHRYVKGFMIVLPITVPIVIASMLTGAIIIELLTTGVLSWLLWRQLQWLSQSST
jgi:hypothetical protein